MDQLYLTKPAPAYAGQIADYRCAFLKRGDSLDGTAGLERFETPAAWLAYVQSMAAPETSRRTILAFGGVLENEVPETDGITQRYWVVIPEEKENV